MDIYPHGISHKLHGILCGKNLTEKEDEAGIDLCRSLEYCGQLHIIHRTSNLNIFVSRFGDFKLGTWNRQRTEKKP